MKYLPVLFVFIATITFSPGWQPVSAQSNNFKEVGSVRPVISEGKVRAPFALSAAAGAEANYSQIAAPAEYYFQFSATVNGRQREKWISLPDDSAWGRLSNKRVIITGNLENGGLSSTAFSVVQRQFQDTVIPLPTAGLYKIVAVPLTIQPLSGPAASRLTITPEVIRNTLFDDPRAVNKFYQEASYGRFGFTGVHHPQVDVVQVSIQATISTNCQDQIVTQFTPIVRQRLLEQNIDTTNGSVDIGLIIFNDTAGCPNYPFATRGALGGRGGPQWVWMPESWFVTGPAIVAHEIGHALGGNHPLSLRCTNFDDIQTCIGIDAADRDLMTSAGRFYMMPNNFERRRWGWHPPEVFAVASAFPVDMFDLRSPSLPFGKDGLVRGRYYFRNLAGAHQGRDIYPEARQNRGLFELYSGADAAFRYGITVRIGERDFGDPETFSVLLDPNTTAETDDAPLRLGQQITIGGLTITCIRESVPASGTRMAIQ